MYYSITFGCSRFSHLMGNRDTNKDIVLGQQFYLLKWENENINGNTIDMSYEIENQNTYHTSKNRKIYQIPFFLSMLDKDFLYHCMIRNKSKKVVNQMHAAKRCEQINLVIIK